MKFLKKSRFLSMLLVMLFFISATAYAMPNKMNLSSDQIKQLDNLGFTPKEIETLTKEEYDAVKDLHGEKVSQEEGYYKIYEKVDDSQKKFFSKSINNISNENNLKNTQNVEIEKVPKEIALKEVEKLKQSQSLLYNTNKNKLYSSSIWEGNNEGCSWLKLTTTVTYLGKYNGKKKFHFKNSFEWLTKPVQTRVDAISCLAGNMSKISGSEQCIYKSEAMDYRYSFLGEEKHVRTTFDSKSNNVKQHTNGVSFDIDLYEDILGTIMHTTHYGYIRFEAYVTHTDVEHSNAIGDYAHAKKNSSFSYSLSFPLGICITPTDTNKVTNAKQTNVDFDVKNCN